MRESLSAIVLSVGLFFSSSTFILSLGLFFSSASPAAVKPHKGLYEKATHLLGRLAYGPRPGEIKKLVAQGEKGLKRWIAEQMSPSTLPDPLVDGKIAKLKIANQSTADLISHFQRLDKIAMEMGLDKEKFKDDEQAKKELREKIGKENLPEEIVREMSTQKLIRAVESQRQLQEILADFWFNHFNIDIQKGEEKWLLPAYEREVIRPRLFGKFRDLLVATAHSPAMLFYLDNQQSVSAIRYNPRTGEPMPRDTAQANGGKRASAGLNENYARELLELHTLGVDGGYTQSDVTELARILTGWSIESKENPVFKFREGAHDRGAKRFLGTVFPAGQGQEEGERALEMLAHHSATAHFVATKLCRFFVSDKPPAALVNRVAKRFTDSDGDLTQVYLAIFNSPEFWSPEAYHAKIRTPLQFSVAAVRALGGELDEETQLPKILAAMGEELYHCPPPTGYKDDAETWVNPGAMVSRLNLALKLSTNRVDGVFTQLPRLDTPPRDATKLVREVAKELVHETLSPASEKVVLSEFQVGENRITDGEIRPLSLAKATAMILGSPEFQRR